MSSSDAYESKDTLGEVDTALLDADLFIKYGAPQRAIERLRDMLLRMPRSVRLRERLREIASGQEQKEEAARQCLALASLYIERDNLDAAHDRLLEAKQHDPRINIAPGLDAIRRARRPELQYASSPNAPTTERRPLTFGGDLSTISLFDAIQVIENARLTGALSIETSKFTGRILFNRGKIVGAETSGLESVDAFRRIVEAADGIFDLEKSAEDFPVTIKVASNTNLILDSLRQLDEENR